MKNRLFKMALILIMVSFSATATLANEESEKLRKKAEDALQKQDIGTAIIHLKNALKADAEDTQARITLGDLYFLKGEYYKAENEYEKVMGLKADDKLFILSLGESYNRQGKFQEILDKVQPGNRGDDIESKILGIRGFAFLNKGDTEKAEKLISEAVAQNPNDPNILLWEVNLYAEMKDYTKAEKALDKIIEKDPDFARALVIKGNFLRARNQLEEASSFYARAIKQEPKNFQARMNRALSEIGLNQSEKAIEDIKYLETNYTKHPMTKYLSALIFSQNAEDGKATEKLLEMGAFINEYPPALYLMGILNLRNEKLEQAESNFRMLLGIAPQSAEVRILLSGIYMSKNNPKKAIDILNEIIDEDTSDERLLGALSTAYIRNGNVNKGAEILERIVNNNPDNAVFQTRLALTKFRTGQSDEAIKDLEEIVAKNPDDLQSSMILAVSYIQTNQFDQAEKAINTLKEKMPDSPVPDNLLGSVYIKKGDKAAAEDAFNRAIEAKSDFTSAYLNLARLKASENDMNGAKEEFQKILKFDDKNLEAYLGLSQIALKNNDKDAVISYLETAYEKNPEKAQAGLSLVNFYLTENDTSNALDQSRKMVRKFSNNILVLDALGRSQLASKQPESAIDTYRKIISINKALPMGYYRMAQAMHMAENAAGAKRNLQQAIEADPNFMLAYRDLIQIAIKEENYSDALKVADNLKNLNTTSSFGDMVAGDIYIQKNDPQQALIHYKEGMKIQENAQLVSRLYRTEIMLGQKEAAIQTLDQWLAKHPEDPQILAFKAASTLNSGDIKNATLQYEKLIKLAPENPMALNNLAWLYTDSKPQEALTLAKKAHEIVPNSPEVADTYGWILVKTNDAKAALPILKEAAAKAQNSPAIQYHYAYALHKTGDNKEAIKILKSILSNAEDFQDRPDAQKLLKEIEG